MNKTLWDYQVGVVHTVTGSDHDYLVEQPTGSGKTVEIVAIAELLLQQGKKVLIAAPQEHIEENFTRRDYDVVAVNGQTLSIGDQRLLGARRGASSTAEVRAYLSNPQQDHALVCTHATLTRVRPPSGIPAPLLDYVLIIDEAHHAPALGLSQFVTAWKAAGGRVLYFTATGYRNDEADVRLAAMRTIRRPLPQHMEEGFAPGKIETGLFAVRVQSQVTAEQFRGDAAPDDRVQRRLIKEMVSAWLKEDRPKTVIRLPSLRGGTGNFVAEVVKTFRKVGAEVLDATGSGAENKDRFLGDLRSERALTDYTQSRFDVVVGIQRVTEGLDWPLCSTVYCVGLPSSLPFVIQLLGRATRRKHQVNYPQDHSGRSKISFFVPVRDGDTMANLPEHHCRKALLVCSFLAHSQAGCEWAAVKHISRGLPVRLDEGTQTPNQSVAEEYPYVDPTYRAEAELALLEAEEVLRAAKQAPTPGNMLKWVLEHRPSVNQAVVEQVLVEQMVATSGETTDRARAALVEAVKSHLAEGTPLRRAIEGAFAVVLAEFRDVAVVHNHVTAHLREQLVSLTGNQVLKFAQRLSQERPLTPTWLRQVVQEYKDVNKDYPDHRTPDGPMDWPGETWKAIDAAIRNGLRQWPRLPVADLPAFAYSYGKYGAMRDFLGRMIRIYNWNDPRKYFIEHLLAEKVQTRLDGPETFIEFGDLPAPGWLHSHRDLFHVLGAWHRRFTENYRYWHKFGLMPYLWSFELVDAIEDELANHEIRPSNLSRLIKPSDKSDYTQMIRRRTIRYQVPPGPVMGFPFYRSRKLSRTVFSPGDIGDGILWRCGHSETKKDVYASAILPENQEENLRLRGPVANPIVVAMVLLNMADGTPVNGGDQIIGSPEQIRVHCFPDHAQPFHDPRIDASQVCLMPVDLPLSWIVSVEMERHINTPDWQPFMAKLPHGEFTINQQNIYKEKKGPWNY